MTSIRFTVAGLPVPQGSMKGFSRGGRVHLTSDNPKLKDWRTQVAYAAQFHAPKELLEGALSVCLHFTLPRPASVKRNKRPLPTSKPDVDKLTRGILDALTNVVWRDDSQVTRVSASKRYDDNNPPGVLVEVEEDHEQ